MERKSAPSSRDHRSCRVDEVGVTDPDVEFVSFGIVRVLGRPFANMRKHFLKKPRTRSSGRCAIELGTHPRAFVRIQTVAYVALDIIQRTIFNEQVHCLMGPNTEGHVAMNLFVAYVALDIIQRTIFNEQVHCHMALCIRSHEAARRCDVTKRRPVGSHFLSRVTEPQPSQ